MTLLLSNAEKEYQLFGRARASIQKMKDSIADGEGGPFLVQRYPFWVPV